MSEVNPTNQDPEMGDIQSQLVTELVDKHLALQHAVQTGIATYIPLRPQSVEPKHLRVGINSALVGQGGLAKLLMDKGVITPAEYWQSQVEAMEREVRQWEIALSEMLGKPVRLF